MDWNPEQAEAELSGMKRTSCTCEDCKEMCTRPCWPSPQEVRRLIEAGLGDRLMEDWWQEGWDERPIICPANKGREGERAAWWPDGASCTFHDNNGMCQLHDMGLKPIEGRLANCRNPNKRLHKLVASMWIGSEEADAVVADWRLQVSKNNTRAKTPNKPRTCTPPTGEKKKASNRRKREEKVASRGWDWPPPPEHTSAVG